jgi:hypothetical protein
MGMEASGHAGWFERLLPELSIELWMGARRRELLEVLDRINPTIAELTRAIEQQARCWIAFSATSMLTGNLFRGAFP